ncbi:MAG: hypothetical protein PVF80_13540, partial [Gammaproteobacteria bacterium]
MKITRVYKVTILTHRAEASQSAAAESEPAPAPGHVATLDMRGCGTKMIFPDRSELRADVPDANPDFYIC